MDEQLRKVQTPPRNQERKDESLVKIKKKIQRRTHFKKGHYYITLLATAVVIFLVMISLLNPAQNFTAVSASGAKLEKVYKFYNNSSEPIYNIDKWYYTDKVRLIGRDDLAFFEAMSGNVTNSTEINTTQWPAAMNDYLLIYKDGTKHYLQYWSTFNDDGVFTFLLDPVTNHVYKTSQHQNEKFYTYAKNRQGMIYTIFAFIGLVLLSIIVITFMERKKLIGQSTIQKMNKRPLVKGILFYIYYVVVSGLSIFLFNTIQGVFIFALLFAPFVFNSWRNYGKSNYTTSVWTLPFIALLIIYFVFVLKM